MITTLVFLLLLCAVTITALVFLVVLRCCDTDASVLSQGEKCGVAGMVLVCCSQTDRSVLSQGEKCGV